MEVLSHHRFHDGITFILIIIFYLDERWLKKIVNNILL